MGIIKEFKDFALKGNFLDMAIGIIIGAEFGKVVNSIVNDLLMPPLGKLIGGVNFSELKYSLGQTPALDAKGNPIVENGVPQVKEAFLNYGNCIQTMLNFFIIAVAIFAVVKAKNMAEKRLVGVTDPAAPPPPPEDVMLLREIRDELKKRPAV
ncbi:Large-conductance mechanosensitive channel [Caulifigura coniformis]|uniref:Large-conductance mechanosensitive channel n=1 Tax=Caulifigura coniformis TaxID=2527983 RepID=A0A517SGZ5_9PLAN|nr:large-conductance mechanosensitive channel protein MscL [Caulifigura coniformis]QDT55396.1 Large-conductance mechanosensitive channel [Caulifigura coniformis]